MPRMENSDQIEKTEFGWAIACETMPYRKDMMWLKLPERHIYQFDGDGWFRVKPPEPGFIPEGDLNHG